MLQLRLTQHAAGEDRHRVEISLEGDGPRRTATCTFPFQLSPQDEEGMRWYLEDFLQYPQAPAPMIARRIEGRLAEMGTELFQADEDTRDIWSRVRERLPKTRIEIITGVAEAATIPWELLRELKRDAAIALTVQSFVRTEHNPSVAAQLPVRKKGKKIRILLVICRPRAEKDVPFRSVASRLIKGLGKAHRRRLLEARTARRSEEELFRLMSEAVRLNHEALNLLPADAVNDLAVVHNQLGNIYVAAGDSTARYNTTGSRFLLRKCRATSTVPPGHASMSP